MGRDTGGPILGREEDVRHLAHHLVHGPGTHPHCKRAAGPLDAAGGTSGAAAGTGFFVPIIFRVAAGTEQITHTA